MNVKVKMDIKHDLKKIFHSEQFRIKLAETIQKQMTDAMSSGLSPVRGVGRFARYKNRHRYPGNRKPATPVNLFLNGNLYNSLWFRYVSDRYEFGVMVKEVDEYAAVHNGDASAKGVVPRKFLPNKPREQFNVSIMVAIRRLLSERLGALIRESNNKP